MPKERKTESKGAAAKQPSLNLTWDEPPTAVGKPDSLHVPAATAPGSAAVDGSAVAPGPDSDRVEPETPAAAPAAAEQGTGETPSGAVQIVELGATSSSLADILQEARGAANLTVTQVSQSTHIPKQFIELLETGRYDDLPPAIYTKSYITQLCAKYKIEAAPVLAEFGKISGGKSGDAPTASMVVTSEPTEAGSRVQYRLETAAAPARRKSGLSPTMFLVGAVLLGLLLLVLAAVAVQQFRHAHGNGGGPETSPGPPPIDLGRFVVPPELPLKELPIPEE